MNCLFWNMYRDFGVGQMGDMGAHTMDLLWNSIDAGAPTAIEVDQEVSDKFNPDITPVKLKVSFEHPANQWRGPVTVVWYQGGLKPNAPKNYIDMQKIPNGAHLRRHQGQRFWPTSPAASSFPTTTMATSPITSGVRRARCCR